MESRVHYSLVGFFVLLLGACAVMIPLFLSSGFRNQQQYTPYLVRMNESVDGLSPNAIVTYNGVNVGYVKNIQLNPQNTNQVEVLLDIKDGIPVTTHTRAVLQSQGITGLAYIGLKGGALKGAAVLKPVKKALYAEIKSEPSVRMRLDTALTQLMTDMHHLSTQLDHFLSPKNEKAFQHVLDHLDKLTGNLSENTRRAQILMQNLLESSQDLPQVMDQWQRFVHNLDQLSEDIRQNPTVLWRGKAPLPLGPGEEKP